MGEQLPLFEENMGKDGQPRQAPRQTSKKRKEVRDALLQLVREGWDAPDCIMDHISWLSAEIDKSESKSTRGK